MAMSWYEHWIRRYEHRRWTTDDNRMVRPFAWGLEHLAEVAGEEAGRSRQPLANSQQQEKVASEKENENGKSKIENREERGTEARKFLRQYARWATEHSVEWYSAEEVRDYRLDGEN